MNYQMKSKNKSDDQCRCLYDPCRCTEDEDDSSLLVGSVIMFGVLMPTLCFAIIQCAEPETTKYIQVNDKKCEVRRVQDNCGSTGTCSGHDEAICPKD